ncbi:hypothetical protein OG897_34790 [Streptomyces sp. NBC_00237]|uniref:hypothetical protein n=1 Tax=Streptomyces sp. NBC_00237 TaxID=2975687 RepID=UPI00225682CC|nr:hypothetical protein [Streptomyces sp. NBC_00237]MCX5206561.1 hypothetical protein [Streptomyces sp. NBC_00237]
MTGSTCPAPGKPFPGDPARIVVGWAVLKDEPQQDRRCARHAECGQRQATTCDRGEDSMVCGRASVTTWALAA